MTSKLARDLIVEGLTSKLHGPGLGIKDNESGYENEIIEGRLALSYLTGILYPKDSDSIATNSPDAENDNETESSNLDTDDPLSLASEILPSSMGMSFCVVSGSELKIKISAACYKKYEADENDKEAIDNEEKGEKRKGKVKWQRNPFQAVEFEINFPTKRRRNLIFDGNASFEYLSRKLKDNLILVTLSLSNTKINEKNIKDASQKNAENTLFQVGIDAFLKTGKIEQYPEARYKVKNDEDRELRIIYGERRPYGVGHGTSVDWEFDVETEYISNRCVAISTCAMPTAHIWQPEFDNLSINDKGKFKKFENNKIFNLARLSSINFEAKEIIKQSGELVNFYEDWIENQLNIEIDTEYDEDKKRILDRCRRSSERIREGVKLLENKDVLEIFRLANRAMLISMAHSDRISGKLDEGGASGPFDFGTASTDDIDYLSIDKTWRPFQLAYFFLVLPSVWDNEHTERDLVDLIWFSTGGGKTEAYLFVSVFELIKRRYLFGDKGGGVGILNRYTYRFLALDQFQRTATVICALEYLRRSEIKNGNTRIGVQEFSVGLFVGADTSPNKWKQQGGSDELLELLKNTEVSPRENNPFPMNSCPFCGTYLLPKEKKENYEGGPEDAYYGFEGAGTRFKTFCPNDDCEFHQKLPVYFVDDNICQDLPSFVLGTIDKFARIPWRSEFGKILGVSTIFHAPSLIIQDEFHLISGPLGTIASLYEAAFDTVISNIKSKIKPKIISSTATIRNAATQGERMYGREMKIFPSPGLRDDDSFFSKLKVGDKEKSRKYIGLMGQGQTSTVSVQWVVAALLQTVHELHQDKKINQNEYDSYYTLLAYHNSMREFSRISGSTNDEIATRAMSTYSKTDDENAKRPTPYEVLELRANAEVPISIAREKLSKPLDDQSKGIDFVPCTKIISVGVDIQRLSLMLVNGQPMLSSEYIQASSRVGRGAIPGLIFTCYSPTKPRDRSHYESFKHYHESFYSLVEPTSITPGAIPAIERALHAALVTVIRYSCPHMEKNQDARLFKRADPKVTSAINSFKKRLSSIYQAEQEVTERNRLLDKLDQLIDQWEEWANDPRLLYAVRNHAGPTLLMSFGENKRLGWKTLESMRSVDGEIDLV